MDQQVVARANTYWINCLRLSGTSKDDFLAIFQEITSHFETIESELQRQSDSVAQVLTMQDERINRLSETVGKKLRGQDEKIKALEDCAHTDTPSIYIPKNEQDIKEIKSEIIKLDELLRVKKLDERTSPDPHSAKEPVPTDKDGKPEVGLERGVKLKNYEMICCPEFDGCPQAKWVCDGCKHCVQYAEEFIICDYDAEKAGEPQRGS